MSTLRPAILVVGTCDTKADELRYLARCVEAQGADALVMDVGILGASPFAAAIGSAEVAAAAGTTLAALAALGDESAAMAAMARGAVASVAPLAAQREQAIRLDVPGTPVRVFGDHRRLEQALVNLISNAVKYGPQGGPIGVRVRLVGRNVTWTVTDQGPGIPVNEQPHLFERFFVGQNDRKGAGGGVGLGLPTALAIAQAHGGGVDVTSVPGYGSVFSIVVPAEGPPDAE